MPKELIRRRQLLRLAAACVLVVAACSTFRRESELDAAVSDLQDLLNEIADSDSEREQFASVLRRIEICARDLEAEHREFMETFDALMADSNVLEKDLLERLDTFNVRREFLRNNLLHLQDELHFALTSSEWQEVVQVLNQSVTAALSRTVVEG